MKRLAITTGDADGVGPEITIKALLARGPRRDFQPYVYRSRESEREFRKLSRQFHRVIVPSLDDALELPALKKSIIEIVDGTDAPFWVEDAAIACMTKRLDGLVTGPLSKTLIRDCGFKELGHTEILGRVADEKDLFQGYLGSSFSVILATAHKPLREISRTISPALLENALRAADLFRRNLPRAEQRKPIAVLGLNPHAGEGGLIGTEEKMFSRVIAKARRRRIPLVGPLVPDAAFAKENWSRFSVFVAAYHDQGLIPFKMIHGREHGAQLTLGLPFVRTSVDHGTAKDIAGRGLANPGSMRDAIEWAVRLS